MFDGFELERRVAGSGCPVLVVWTEIWREWADDVDGVTIDSGHHMAEEAPEELAAAIQSLLSRSGSARS